MPLEEANELVKVLRAHSPRRLATHRAAFAVARRRDKPFLAMHAVKAALDVGGADDPGAHVLRVELVLWLQGRNGDEGGGEVASGVLAEQLAQLTGVLLCRARSVHCPFAVLLLLCFQASLAVLQSASCQRDCSRTSLEAM
jgi:hypothetical protein